MTTSSQQFETQCLHAGYTPEPTTRACAVPLYRTAAYHFDSTEYAARLFSLEERGNIYTRLTNPTTGVLEERVAALEGGVAAVALASGTSAVHYSIINIARGGDEIVAANDLYGGTYTMFHDILPAQGIATRFVDPRDLAAMEGAINGKTRAVFVESCGNPGLNVPDFRGIADVAHRHHVPLVVDNTFPTPYLCRPLEHGADVVVHSLTKWIGGHGLGIGGIVVDGGTFDWTGPKFDLYATPDSSYHGLRFGHDLGDLQRAAFAVRLRVVPLRNLGACLAPDHAWFFLQGIETLPLRVAKHAENALAIAEYLGGHGRVEWVTYPGLPDHPSHDLATRYLGTPHGEPGFGGVVVFGIKGGREAGGRFVDALRLFSHVANVGDAKSLAIHPGSTTHSQLSEKAQIAGGIKPELIRLSIGLEHLDDIRADLDQALRHSELA